MQSMLRFPFYKTVPNTSSIYNAFTGWVLNNNIMAQTLSNDAMKRHSVYTRLNVTFQLNGENPIFEFCLAKL